MEVGPVSTGGSKLTTKAAADMQDANQANVIKSFKSADDEVVTVCSVLSVRCPLGLGLIDLPVRGINCAHLQCFDLKTFLVFQESARSQAWTCIVCDKWIHLSELRIDPFWKQLLHDVAHDDELELVEIFPDATWKKHTPIDKREKKPKIPMISGGAARSRLVSTDAVDLTLWSDDDEHPVAKTSLWSPNHRQGEVNDKRSTRSSSTAPRRAQLALRHRRSSGSNPSLESGFEDLNISAGIQAVVPSNNVKCFHQSLVKMGLPASSVEGFVLSPSSCSESTVHEASLASAFRPKKGMADKILSGKKRQLSDLAIFRHD
ncbi:hypothetical protein Ae201684P_003711 [Aphanomyces euteiches]|nr:hypothetical protein Ae201684P_003711 [Aphanomyces euteiches]